jgi:hypothetical protein
MTGAHKGVAALTALLFTAGLAALPVQAAQADTQARAMYSNCTALNRDYPHGVSDRRKPRSWWIRNGATGKGAYRPRLYDRVAGSMDRDHDHIACEK